MFLSPTPPPTVVPALSLPLSFRLPHITAFVTTVVIDQLNATDALRSDVGPVKGTDTITRTQS